MVAPRGRSNFFAGMVKDLPFPMKNADFSGCSWIFIYLKLNMILNEDLLNLLLNFKLIDSLMIS